MSLSSLFLSGLLFHPYLIQIGFLSIIYIIFAKNFVLLLTGPRHDCELHPPGRHGNNHRVRRLGRGRQLLGKNWGSLPGFESGISHNDPDRKSQGR